MRYKPSNKERHHTTEEPNTKQTKPKPQNKKKPGSYLLRAIEAEAKVVREVRRGFEFVLPLALST